MGVQMQIAGAVLGYMAAQRQADAYEMEAAAYKENAEMAKIQADQREAARRQQLRRQLASLGTSMSAQGVALGTSQSTSALREDEQKIAKNDIASIKLMGMSNRRKYELGAAGKSAAAGATRLSAMGGFAKSVYSINNPTVT